MPGMSQSIVVDVTVEATTMKVKVEGLREFSKAVAAADKGLKKEIRLAMNEAAE